MALRKPSRPAPGRRFATYSDFAEVTKDEPEKSLVEGLKKSGGRNSRGRKTSRHRGGGAKRLYRKIDFKRRKDDMPARSPRSSTTQSLAYIALLHYTRRPQVLHPGPAAPRGGRDGAVRGRVEIPSATACRWPTCRSAPIVHNVELQPGRGGQMGRAAGTAIQLMAKEGGMATLRLPSGEMRMVRAQCRATIGTIGNADHQNIKVGKAGRKRHMGVRPQTRGTAMNPVDHPHGGGEGSTTPRPPSGDAVGRAHAGLPHPQEEQVVRPLHRPRPQAREEEVER
jgi:large subunit ribosomal protein L2